MSGWVCLGSGSALLILLCSRLSWWTSSLRWHTVSWLWPRALAQCSIEHTGPHFPSWHLTILLLLTGNCAYLPRLRGTCSCLPPISFLLPTLMGGRLLTVPSVGQRQMMLSTCCVNALGCRILGWGGRMLAALRGKRSTRYSRFCLA